MNCKSLYLSALLLPALFTTHSNAQTSSASAPISAREMKSLIASANTSAQYKQLATYYQQQETVYRAKATDEKAEQRLRAKVNAAVYQKYPRPEDSSRNRSEAFSADADRAATMAAHYNRLAAAGSNSQQ